MIESKVAVIISVYKNDSYQFVKDAIDSIYQQTEVTVDVYLCIDGEISSQVRGLLYLYADNESLSIIENGVNRGLAFSLNRLITENKLANDYNYIARMDADDLSLTNRFHEQIAYMKSNNVDVCGCAWIEIDDEGTPLKEVYLSSSDAELKVEMVRRSPFNHPSVVFSSKIFLAGFLYNPSLKTTQDYFLWVDLAVSGFRFGNVPKILFKFRRGKDFYERRGVKKALLDLRGRFYAMRKLRAFSLYNITFAFILFVLRLSPRFVKSVIYKYFR